MYFQELNDEFLNDPNRWFNEAILLKNIADDIYLKFGKEIHDGERGRILVHSVMSDKPEIVGPYGLIGPCKMMIGLALENIVKGLLVKREGKFLREWIGINGHDLKRLITDLLDFSVSDIEKDLLKDLSSYVHWAGRYPAPKSSNAFKDLLPKGHLWAFSNFDLEDMARIENLYIRLEANMQINAFS